MVGRRKGVGAVIPAVPLYGKRGDPKRGEKDTTFRTVSDYCIMVREEKEEEEGRKEKKRKENRIKHTEEKRKNAHNYNLCHTSHTENFYILILCHISL